MNRTAFKEMYSEILGNITLLPSDVQGSEKPPELSKDEVKERKKKAKVLKGQDDGSDKQPEFIDNYNWRLDRPSFLGKFVSDLSYYTHDDKMTACKMMYRMLKRGWAKTMAEHKQVATRIMWSNGNCQIRALVIRHFLDTKHDDERTAMLKGIKESTDNIDAVTSYHLMEYLIPLNDRASRDLSNEIYSTLSIMQKNSNDENVIVGIFESIVEEEYSIMDKIRLYWNLDNAKSMALYFDNVKNMEAEDIMECAVMISNGRSSIDEAS